MFLEEMFERFLDLNPGVDYGRACELLEEEWEYLLEEKRSRYETMADFKNKLDA